jgi:hypothetical protein
MKRIAGNLLVLVLGGALALLLLEGVLRLVGFTPSPLLPDRAIGYHYAPDTPYHWRGEGASDGRTSHRGWRDRDYSTEKPNFTTRILVIGDSYVQALQVPLDSTFHKRLERMLSERRRPGHAIEVPAMGLAGIGTTQEYMIYESEGRALDPDVVAVLWVPNDPADDSPIDASNTMRPYLLASGDSLRLDTSFVTQPGFRRWERTLWIRRHSALVTAVGQASERLRRRAVPAVGDPKLTDSTGWYHRWNFAWRPPADSIPQFRLSEKILARFAAAVQRDGHRFVLIVEAAPQQADRDEMAWYAAHMPIDIDKTARWLTSVGERHGFEVLSLVPGFRAVSAAGGGPLWIGSPLHYGHWTAAGHTLAARIMADYFTRTLPDSVIAR